MTRNRNNKPTLADVARLAGVAKSTASLAFNSPARVKTEKLEAIRAAAGELGFAPNAVARILKSGRHALIGHLVGDLQGSWHGVVIRELERHIASRDHFVITALSDPEHELSILRRFASLKLNGAIISFLNSSQKIQAEIDRLDLTLVTFDQKPAFMTRDHVGLDNQISAKMLTRHLLELGHRDICQIAGIETSWTGSQRLAGFKTTMLEAGISLCEDHVAYGYYDEDRAYQAAVQVMSRSKPPTALMATNSDTAVGVLKALRSLGLRCPEDISLVSFDSISNSALISPNLTAIHQPLEEMAQAAAEMLFHRIEAGYNTEPAKDRLFVPNIVYGNSTKMAD